jgi:hypothetical protein
MSPGLRLWLLPLLIAGCAHPFLVVPDSDWQTVPAPQRAAIDRQHEAAMVSARAELKSATAGLADALRTPAAPAPSGPAGAMAKPDPDADPWAMAIYDHDQSRAAARARVRDATEAWQRTRLTWRQHQLDAASARIDVLVCDRELTRARAIDRSLPGSDHYDSAPLQGQFSAAQKRWHAASTAARKARIEFERASTTLASAKEAYAQLMRNGPVHLAMQLPTDTDERPRLELTTWTVTRNGIGRRKGLRHLLEAAASAPPQLRKRELRLRPAPRMPATETPRASTPLVAPLPGASAPAAEAAPNVKSPASIEQPRPTGATSSTSPPPSPKPWDLVEPAPRRSMAARSVTPAATAASSRRAPRVEAPASPKPWDFVEPGTAPVALRPAAARTAVATRPRKLPAVPPAPKPWDFVEPAVQPAAARTPVSTLPVANASAAAKPWDFVEPAVRPAAAAARSASAHQP